MVRVFSYVGSAAGTTSHTKELSDRLATALAELLSARGEDLSYECVTADQLKVSLCRSCNSCFKTGTCPLDGTDDVGELKRKLLEADIVLVGTPVYLAYMSGAAKCVLVRMAFWAHRLELAGKAGMALVTTSNNHGPQVEGGLRELLQCFGLAMPEGLCLQLNASPRLDASEEADPAISAAAKRLLEAWDNPAVHITRTQELLWKGLALQTRQKMTRHYLLGREVYEETRVLDERRISDYDSFATYVRSLRELDG